MMNETQRVYLAICLCVGIFLSWHVWVLPTIDPAGGRQPVVAAQSQKPINRAVTGVVDGTLKKDALDHEPTPKDAVDVLAQWLSTPIELRDISTSLLRGKVSTEYGQWVQLDLPEYIEREALRESPQAVSLLSGGLAESTSGGFAASVKSLESLPGQAFISWQIPGVLPLGRVPLSFITDAQQVPHLVLMRGQTPHGVQVEIEMLPHSQDYVVDYTLRIKNTGTTPIPVGAKITLALVPPAPKERGFLNSPAETLNAVCDIQGNLVRQPFEEVQKTPFRSSQAARWVALDRQYFVVALVPESGVAAGCSMTTNDRLLQVALDFGSETLLPNALWEKKLGLYAGPKRDDRLSAGSSLLTETIDYNIWKIPLGFLARPMVYLLNVLHDWTTSWGMAIVMLTVVVKLLLFPFTYKSVLSARRIQLLKPQLEAIKEKYAQDKERQQLEQLKLFREQGVNPLSGCLPMLLQMPVWFALYRMLWSAVDLYQQSFLWLPDLTAKEPWPILAIMIGALTLVQQKLTPMATADQSQAKVMMYLMPVMLTVFMVALPSGLVLYILVNSLLTIVQQLAINKRTVAIG